MIDDRQSTTVPNTSKANALTDRDSCSSCLLGASCPKALRGKLPTPSQASEADPAERNARRLSNRPSALLENTLIGFPPQSDCGMTPNASVQARRAAQARMQSGPGRPPAVARDRKLDDTSELTRAPQSMIRSAFCNSDGGIVRPKAFAVLR